jgi:hypothetical protein
MPSRANVFRWGLRSLVKLKCCRLTTASCDLRSTAQPHRPTQHFHSPASFVSPNIVSESHLNNRTPLFLPCPSPTTDNKRVSCYSCFRNNALYYASTTL